MLVYLMDEICAGVEIYFSGRIGGQYLKTAFILCDDYTELTSKLFLRDVNLNWSDLTQSGRFKSYGSVLDDVAEAVGGQAIESIAGEILGRMRERRKRRNDFFHSTQLLDLGVTIRMCVQGFCDLLAYGELLFAERWRVALSGCRNLETYGVLLRLEQESWRDPGIPPQVNRILAAWPRNIRYPSLGTQVAQYPEDLHLRLCVTTGGDDLLNELRSLLP
jgi:hypothetical protein